MMTYYSVLTSYVHPVRHDTDGSNNMDVLYLMLIKIRTFELLVIAHDFILVRSRKRYSPPVKRKILFQTQ